MKERHRDARGLRWLDDLARDLAFGWRTLRRSPGFAAVAVLTLTIAIGANTAVFSVVNGILLQPLPYHAPDDLVALYDRYIPESGLDIPQMPMSLPEVLDYRDQARAVAQVGYFRVYYATITPLDANPVRVDASFVSADLLPVLGVQPRLGRWFTEAEHRPNGPTAAILSHALWTEWFGQDPTVVGRTVTIDGVATEVVGIMPQGFGFPNERARLYLSIRTNEASPGDRDNHGIRAIGRLATGQTLASASAELETMMSRWAQQDDHHRGETRSREVAVRVALGAGRGRVIRQLLTESLVIAGLGGMFGVGLAWLGLQGLLAVNPASLPRLDAIGLDPSVLAFTAVCSLGSAVLFGLMPALHAGRWGISGRMDTRGTNQSGRAHLRRGLVSAEVALSVVVVISAGLVVRSFQTLTRVDPGMEVDGLLTFNLSLPATDYPTSETRLGFDGQVLERLGALPGVTHVSFLHMLPIPEGGRYLDFTIEGRAPRSQGEPPWNAPHYVVSADYVATAGLPLLRGRTFTDADGTGTQIVALISDTAARRFWPGEDPIGRRIGYDEGRGPGPLPLATIVGTVGDIKVAGLQYDTFPQIYVLQNQTERLWGSTDVAGTVLVRSTTPLDVLVPSARRLVSELDPTLPISNIRTLADVIAASVARPRLVANMLGSFGLVALLLAALGVYGVVSYAVACKTREIGIRIALGATHRQVIWKMTHQGTKPALLGVGVGVMVTLLATRVVEGLLFQVSRTDPLTLTLVPVLLVTVALTASWIPSQRAARIAPTEALRAD